MTRFAELCASWRRSMLDALAAPVSMTDLLKLIVSSGVTLGGIMVAASSFLRTQQSSGKIEPSDARSIRRVLVLVLLASFTSFVSAFGSFLALAGVGVSPVPILWCFGLSLCLGLASGIVMMWRGVS